MKPKRIETKYNYHTRLENAKTLADIFEVVKAAVWESEMKSHGGFTLGLADLGNHPHSFIGAFFTVSSNFIVMNKIPLHRIEETRPELYKSYVFHVMLHEYIHSLGYLNEHFVRQKVYEISKDILGETQLATLLAKDTTRFFPNLVYPSAAWKPDNIKIELVEGFDSSSVNYIN